MIFMNFFALNSRVTGPKMRVPIGSPCLLISTAALRQAIDAVTPDLLRGAHDHRLMDVALLHLATRNRFLDRHYDHVAHRRGPALGAAKHLDALHPARAGVVGDFQVRLHLDHGIDLSFDQLAPDAPVSLTTSQRFDLEMGRHSRIVTTSPTLQALAASWAAKRFERRMNFL
jgi:hypothetical protein